MTILQLKVAKRQLFQKVSLERWHWRTRNTRKENCIVHFIFLHCTWAKKPTSYLPAFFTKPESASASLQISQRKQSGCQFACMAFITRPITNLPTTKQQHCQSPPHTHTHTHTHKCMLQIENKTLLKWCFPQVKCFLIWVIRSTILLVTSIYTVIIKSQYKYMISFRIMIQTKVSFYK